MADLLKQQWQIPETEIKVDYYVDTEHAAMLERLSPHDQITGGYPFDTAARGILLPFELLCKHQGYAGLGREGYQTLADYLKRAGPAEAMFAQWSNVAQIAESGMLFARTEGDQKVYFPTGMWVLGTKPRGPVMGRDLVALLEQ
ncbi:MAG: hypothetical protein WCV90_04200 [Candidatus Woesearchaeota archaeon]|jgi:hypothetical protein